MTQSYCETCSADSYGAPLCSTCEALAEVERLREALNYAERARKNSAQQAAERQREACAEYLKHWTYDEHTLSRVRATPLVTEEEP